MTGQSATTPRPMVDVTIIVPAYNEVQRIEATVAEIHAYFRTSGLTCQVIVSADGNDGTREKVAALAASDPTLLVIGGAERGGKGRGVRNAVPLSTGRIIGFVDADQKTPISEFDKVRAQFDAGCDVVIGSRGLKDSLIETPQAWYRQVGSRGFAMFMHVVVGLSGIRDTQCGFKFFRHDIARDLFSRQQVDGYMFDVEILHLAERSGYRIGQVPVRWRDDGDSRLNLVAGNLKNVADIFRIRFAARTERSAASSDTDLAQSRRTDS